MTFMITLVRIPPRVTTAFIQIDEEVGACVTPCQWNTIILDGLDVLILLWL